MISLKKLAAALVIASTAVATVGSTVQAGEHYDYGHGPAYGHGPGYGYPPVYSQPVPPPQPYYGYPPHRRDRTGEKIATGVAIGVGALILGSIIANQGRRHRY